jgi:hypothetical protein
LFIGVTTYHSALLVLLNPINLIVFSAIGALASLVLNLVVVAAVTYRVLAVARIELFLDVDQFDLAHFTDVLPP